MRGAARRPCAAGPQAPALAKPDHARYTSAMFETLDAYANQLIAFVSANQVWAAPIFFALAFGESLAFLSLLIPAWAALVGIGAMIGPSGISFWPIWLAGGLGAALGDWLSFWVGEKWGIRIFSFWPLSRHPELLPKGEAFVKKWGAAAIVIGRFSGPLRASVPLVAGIFQMPFWRFQLANFSSALLWAGVLILFGGAISEGITKLWR